MSEDKERELTLAETVSRLLLADKRCSGGCVDGCGQKCPDCVEYIAARNATTMALSRHTAPPSVGLVELLRVSKCPNSGCRGGKLFSGEWEYRTYGNVEHHEQCQWCGERDIALANAESERGHSVVEEVE